MKRCKSKHDEWRQVNEFEEAHARYRCTLPQGHDGEHTGELQWVKRHDDWYGVRVTYPAEPATTTTIPPRRNPYRSALRG